jgi:hypothetical protein
MKKAITKSKIEFKGNFAVNPDYAQDRTGNYELRDKIASKWEYSHKDGAGCGNVNHQFYFDTSKQKFIFSDDRLYNDDSFIPMYRLMSPALLLYRLIATFFGNPVCGDNYKSIWDYNIIHKHSGKLLNFSEHKGAIGFRLPESSYTELHFQFKTDLIELMTYLASNECAHPYDNLVAGSVA